MYCSIYHLTTIYPCSFQFNSIMLLYHHLSFVLLFFYQVISTISNPCFQREQSYLFLQWKYHSLKILHKYSSFPISLYALCTLLIWFSGLAKFSDHNPNLKVEIKLFISLMSAMPILERRTLYLLLQFGFDNFLHIAAGCLAFLSLTNTDKTKYHIWTKFSNTSHRLG